MSEKKDVEDSIRSKTKKQQSLDELLSTDVDIKNSTPTDVNIKNSTPTDVNIKNPQPNVKERSASTASDKGRRSLGGPKRRLTKGSSTTSITSNGDGYYGDYDDYDMDEPFSESEGEDNEILKQRSSRRKLNLPIPRGRIRTLSGTVPAVGYSPKWGGPTMCLNCLVFFDLPSMVDAFTEHLLKEHHVVVTEIELIVDLKRYIEYWRQRFAKESLEKIFSKVIPAEGDPYFEKTDYYYAVCEKLAEDYSLRQRLAMRRLEEALSCQQREREELTYSQQCLFCRYTARGNRSKIIHHLYMIHHLNLGSPDNLVFVTEYVEHLRDKLNRSECIYCEKQFNDRTLMMDHMRKRQHREVNPKNSYYDKFYIINYLELGKKWLDVLAEDFEDTTAAFVDSDEEEEEESWHEWQEDNLDEDQTRIVCLFCDETFEKVGSLITHAKEDHLFDVLEIMKTQELDVYGRVKMINFIRKQTYNAICFVCGRDDLGSWQALRKHQTENEHLSKGMPARDEWDTEAYLVPIFDNDHLLWMLESFLDEHQPTANENGQETTSVEVEKTNEDDMKSVLVEEVIPEDLPELEDSPLADSELLDSLK